MLARTELSQAKLKALGLTPKEIRGLRSFCQLVETDQLPGQYDYSSPFNCIGAWCAKLGWGASRLDAANYVAVHNSRDTLKHKLYFGLSGLHFGPSAQQAAVIVRHFLATGEITEPSAQQTAVIVRHLRDR